ncbi:MAG: hypothetical protein AUI14_02815 [Actinobacteria bacterium 13_2_20CM_2_71_6]|nr:MAG: hypothetical protein AUI14_02815 [Actinobacteria bacterium 13_2_20CM_2_71_6]
MTSGGARRGRRDNGLVAAAYAAAGDVDPRVGEHLLDVLAVRGIAAYPPAEPDMDELFAGIVAGYDTKAESITWPAAEDLDDADGPPDEDDEHARQPARLKRWRRSTVDPAVFPRSADLFPLDEDDDEDEEEDEGYVPPPPPPLPRISLTTVVAILSVVAGFVVFFNPDLLPMSGAVAMVLGFLGILAGFVTLIWRLRAGDDDDDWDPDDGAVV